MNESDTEHWIAPNGMHIPDFIICGAMKCGTSTVHSILALHPDVHIPDPEINFFDMDDPFQHADFFIHDRHSWQVPDISLDSNAYWRWYSEFFEEAPSETLLGEDSTTYLASIKAPLRISMQEKPIKIIICLRNPTKRAYSQYWHMLRTGRAMFNFEDTIKYTPNYVLERSMYLEQIRNFFSYIPRDRVFFFVLEDYLSDKERVAKQLLSFLSLSFDNMPNGALDTHSNIVKFPKFVNLHALVNRMLRSYGNNRYIGKLPFEISKKQNSKALPNFVRKVHRLVNPLIVGNPPKMSPNTEAFLDHFFLRELDGLSELIGIDVMSLWFAKKSGEDLKVSPN